MKTQRSTSAPSHDPALRLAPLSCPDCGGVLSLKTEGPRAQPSYVCQIDHRYSVTSLYQAKEYRLEHTLRSAVVQLRQLRLLYAGLAKDKVLPAGIARQKVRQRLREVGQQGEAIGALIEAIHVLESSR